MKRYPTSSAIILTVILIAITGCLNDSKTTNIQIDKETIVLGFFLGMEEKAFLDTLDKRIQSNIIKDVTTDYDIARSLKRYQFQLNTISTTLDIQFFYENDMFYQGKLMKLTCSYREEGKQDSLNLAYEELVNLYLTKYFNYEYSYEIEKIFKQPLYTWTNDSLKVEIYSMLSAMINEGNNRKAISIKDYDPSRYNIYSLYLTITYSHERLVRLKSDFEKSVLENAQRKQYQKADSLSKFI